MVETAQSIQKQIDELQEAIHDKADAHMKRLGETKNSILLKQRAAKISAVGPKDFWAQVFRAHKDFRDELMGSYDDAIFAHLEKFGVEFTEEGFRVEMNFAQNEFFHDRRLWVEFAEGDHITASGVQWKEGKGPLDDDEADDQGAENSGESKRKRDDRGSTFFTLFHDLGPHPEDDSDEELEAMEEERFDEVVEAYEEDIRDAKEVLTCLVEEIWQDPLGCLDGRY